MITNHYLLVGLLSLLTFSVTRSVSQQEDSRAPVTQSTSSELDNRAHCYCSRGCGPRNIEEDDELVLVVKDPAKNYLYCKKWDLDHYNSRCGITNK